MRNYDERWKVTKTSEVIDFKIRVMINAIAIKVFSYLFVISELTLKIMLNKYIYKYFRQD